MDRSSGLPVAHVYGGAWKFFAGGGFAVMDCNGDARPDLYVAGGEGPARPCVNETSGPGAPLAFRDGGAEALTRVTGAYPLDIDGDGHLDLAVLRVGPTSTTTGGSTSSW